jgi:creatinine amidohydrolase
MSTVRYEFLRPHEIIEEKERKSIVYLPVAPLEWHGPAMPYGTDPLAAEAVTRAAAIRTGGVVMPTLYVGTERERSPEILEAKGFEDTSQYIVGMDVPKNSMKSFYTKEDMFGVIVREFLRMLVMQGYKLIVIVNGHGAKGQIDTLNRLAIEFTNETDSHVMVGFPVASSYFKDPDFGHGTILETSIQMYLNPENVDLKQFPSKPEKLKNTDWGIADSCTFSLHPNKDKTIISDPRDATAERGERYVVAAVNELVIQVEGKWKDIGIMVRDN